MAKHIGLCFSECGLFLSKHKPFLGASPNSIVDCDCCGKGVVEVKCPLCAEKSSLEEAAKGTQFCLDKGDGKFRINRSHSYYYQCRLQLYVTKCLDCYFVVLSTDEVHIARIVLDIDLPESWLTIFKNSVFFQNCWESGLHGRLRMTKKLKKMMSRGVSAKRLNVNGFI